MVVRKLIEELQRLDPEAVGDPYLYIASKIYSIPFQSMSKDRHKTERALGKKAMLDLGYQNRLEEVHSR